MRSGTAKSQELKVSAPTGKCHEYRRCRACIEPTQEYDASNKTCICSHRLARLLPRPPRSWRKPASSPSTCAHETPRRQQYQLYSCRGERFLPTRKVRCSWVVHSYGESCRSSLGEAMLP